MYRKNFKKPSLSIITVVFNGEKYLEQTIISVIDQTYENIEYIVLDGASSDMTIEIIKRYENDITVWKSEKDNGIYDAMNKGIDLATGDFIWFLNAGDVIYENLTVEKIFENYNNKIDVLYGQMQLINEDGLDVSIFKVPKSLTYRDFMYGMAVSHQAIIIKKELISYYNLNYKVVSDHDWIISALKKSKNIIKVDLVFSKYLLGGFSDKNFYTGWNERLIIMKKQYNRFAYILNLLYFIKAISRKFIYEYIIKKG